MQNDRNRVPLDVMLEVISHLGPSLMYASGKETLGPVRHHTLRNLALACREYLHFVLPFLFETISIYRSPNPPRSLRFCMGFYRSVLDGDEHALILAEHVRTYIIDSSVSTKIDPSLDFVFSCKVVSFFPNLRELRVIRFDITNDFLSTMVSLPQPLQVLWIEECSASERLDEALLQKFAAVHVMRMHHASPDDDEEYQDLQFASHYPLSRTTHLTSSRRTNYLLLEGLVTSRRPMDHLQHLKLGLVESDGESYPLTEFLKQVPALKTLHIEYFEYLMDDPPQELGLIPCAEYPKLPHLEHIHAHIPALRALVPGSAVRLIGIATEDTFPVMKRPTYGEGGQRFWRPYAEAFTKSLQPITSMDVPMDFYISIRFATYFPSLKTLNVRPKHWNWCSIKPISQDEPNLVIMLFLHAWDSHPNLTELQFVYDYYQLELPQVVTHEAISEGVIGNTALCSVSENTLQSLRQMMPSLKSVTFWDQRPPRRCGKVYRIFVR